MNKVMAKSGKVYESLPSLHETQKHIRKYTVKIQKIRTSENIAVITKKLSLLCRFAVE